MVDLALNAQDFLNGELIREPVGTEPGYWVGAPGVFQDASDGSVYLTYRIRRPRGVQPDRGGESRIARALPNSPFEDIWSVQKDAYESTSIERSAIRCGPDGTWRYFTSFVDPADSRWCTVLISSDNIEDLDPSKRQVLFAGPALDLEGVKDPFIFEENGTYHMFLSVAEKTPDMGDDAHQTNDIYNTGQCISATALATSTDLVHWDWQGVVFRPDADSVNKTWDGYCRRINSVIRKGDAYIGFYDGSKSYKENYEERPGIAISKDLKNWQTVTPDGPIVTTPNATGSIRYIDALPTSDQHVNLYFEIARPDGAHELRRCKLNLDTLIQE